MKQKILLAQPNYKFGNNVYLPYAVGRIWAYCNSIESIAAKYEVDFLYLRDPLDSVVKTRYDVLGLSCYIWNWEYNKALAKAYKSLHPDCLIVMGGPQIPADSTGFFDEHYYVDLIIHGEAEKPFANILMGARWKAISGVSVRHHAGKTVRNETLDDLPSPYLCGIFDSLLKEPYDWQASQETDRGCPYQCTFCCWGLSTNKVVRFNTDEVMREVDWFSRNKIELVYNCDANFGMHKRDVDIISRMVQNNKEFGYPKKFRAAYDKNLTGRVFEISKILNDAGMSKGTTLSFQSLNPATLKSVNRKNMKREDSIKIIEQYNNAGMATYTELILGLPFETYGSFIGGIEFLLDAGLHYGLSIYTCMVFPNSEMASEEYRERHGIKTKRIHQLLNHGFPDEINEFYDIVVETSTMSHAEWRKAFIFSWVIQAFHSGGFTDLLAMDARKKGLNYRRFYEVFIAYGEQSHGAIGREFKWINTLLSQVLNGEKWQTAVFGFGSMTWPPEEATILRLALARDEVYEELGRLISDPGLIERQKERSVNPTKYADLDEFAREAVWYARRGKRTNVEQTT